MLSTARVTLPAQIVARLRRDASFYDNVNDFARDDLIGFKRPFAATFALVVPVTLALLLHTAGPVLMLKFALIMVIFTIACLYLLGRMEWPTIVSEFQILARAKQRATADLRCGFGESSFLNAGRAPQFYRYSNGVLAIADAGDLKTLFFDITNDETDPRWTLFEAGDLQRRVWRWIRLPASFEVVKFSTEGSKFAQRTRAVKEIDSIEAWEAIHVALGEPIDGAVIHMPFDEVIETIDRLL